MKTQVFEYKGAKYWAEVKRMTKRRYTDYKTHYVYVYKEGETTCIAGCEINQTKQPFMTAAHELIDGYLKLNENIKKHGLAGLLI